MNSTDIVIEIEFPDNRLLPVLFGERDRYLHRIEENLHITLSARGNRVLIQGEEQRVMAAQTVLQRLHDRLKQGLVVSSAEVDAAVRMAINPGGTGSGSEKTRDVSLATRRKVITARTPGQAVYLDMLGQHELVFSVGPAGTGKTYLAVATAVSMLLSGQVKRIILSRPAVEAGEKLGFLPGHIRDKVDPYLRPLYDALYDMLPEDGLAKRFETGEIEVAPLAFMRGRTLSNAFVILDEAQNTTRVQMKMFLTRLGEGSRMVIAGDLEQIDLPHGVGSGLDHAVRILGNVDGVGICRLSSKDVVRHPLVTRIVEAYDANEKPVSRNTAQDNKE